MVFTLILFVAIELLLICHSDVRQDPGMLQYAYPGQAFPSPVCA
jgi:hypothetical protein